MVVIVKQLDGLLVKKGKKERKKEQNKKNKHFVDVTILVLIADRQVIKQFLRHSQ